MLSHFGPKMLLVIGVCGVVAVLGGDAYAFRRPGRGTISHGEGSRQRSRPRQTLKAQPRHRESKGQRHKQPQSRLQRRPHERPRHRPRRHVRRPHRRPRHFRPRYHYHPRPHYHSHPWFGGVVLGLPHGYFAFSIGGYPYYYHSGVYYRRRPRGYAVVSAPIGAAIAALPNDAISIYVGPAHYFYYYGTYYSHDPLKNDYVVTSAPVGAVVPTLPDGHMSAYVNGLKYFVIGGVYYRPVYQGSNLVYEVVPSPDSSSVATVGLVPENLYAYPKAGQSPEQQARDHEACQQWAGEQTGFDPKAPQAQAALQEQQQRLLSYNRAFSACMVGRNYTVE